MAKAKNGAELLVQCLEAQGVKYIFGIPGAKVDTIFDVLADHGPQLILCRHEQNAAFMAGMYGLLTGTPGVCLVTSGPGVTNLVTGLSTATYDGYPLVALGGNVRRGLRHIKTHQSLDNVGVMKAVTKHSVEIYDGDSIPEAVVNAFRESAEPPLGATFISLPQDVLMGPVEAVPLPPMTPAVHGVAGADAIQEVARRINSARLPVIFAGMFASRPDVTAGPARPAPPVSRARGQHLSSGRRGVPRSVQLLRGQPRHLPQPARGQTPAAGRCGLDRRL